MKTAIENLEPMEVELVVGGVTEGPDGQGCTGVRNGTMLQSPSYSGGPAQIELSPNLFG